MYMLLGGASVQTHNPPIHEHTYIEDMQESFGR